MSISYNIVFQVLRWWSCSSWLHSKKHFTKPYSSQPNGYGYVISHPGCYSWKGSFWITNSVDAHLMREHQTEVLKHFHPPGSSSVSSWGFVLVRHTHAQENCAFCARSVWFAQDFPRYQVHHSFSLSLMAFLDRWRSSRNLSSDKTIRIP